MSMLEGSPWLLAHKSMLKVNQPKKVSLYGKDYVLWLDQKGKIQALPNACPHMGAMLSEGWCEKREDGESAVFCPFHALGFDRAGCTIMPGSRKKTVPQLAPLKLIIENDFIWSYGDKEPKIQINNVLNEIADRYEYIGHTADLSLETDLLSMLLNMHDYNHQNGTHRPLFKVKEVRFKEFIDDGHHSHAIYDLPTTPITWKDVRQNPSVLLVPKTVHVHLENLFPYCLIFYAKTVMGKIAQIHLFLPESSTHTRTFVLLYAIPRHRALKILSGKFLEFAKVITQQDADILSKIYPNSPQKMKLNNEVGMDWVKRNFKNWPSIVEPQLSLTANSQAPSVLTMKS